MFNQEYVRECFGSVWALLMKINYKMVSEMVVRFKFTIIHFQDSQKICYQPDNSASLQSACKVATNQQEQHPC